MKMDTRCLTDTHTHTYRRTHEAENQSEVVPITVNRGGGVKGDRRCQ